MAYTLTKKMTAIKTTELRILLFSLFTSGCIFADPIQLDWSQPLTNTPEVDAGTWVLVSADAFFAGKGPAERFAVRQRENANTGQGNTSSNRLIIFTASGQRLLTTEWVQGNAYPEIWSWTTDHLKIRFRNGGEAIRVYELHNGTYIETLASPFPAYSMTSNSTNGLVGLKRTTTIGSLVVEYFTTTDAEPEKAVGISVEVLSGETATIRWPSEEGVTYRLQQSTDMETWTTLPEIISGTGQPITRTLQAEALRLFFRVASN
jgi:hypothetical protein